jgi:hypothetical protein
MKKRWMRLAPDVAEDPEGDGIKPFSSVIDVAGQIS